MRIYVLDSSAIINYLNRYYAPGLCYYTTNSVLEEVKSSLSRIRLECSMLRGELRILDPTPEDIEEVVKNAKRTGDFFKLSKTDIEVLALALRLKRGGGDVVIITDDYAIMNLSIRLRVPFKPALMSPISEYREVILVCPVCHYKVRIDEEGGQGVVCPLCGTELKLVIRRRKRIHRSLHKRAMK
ncbi:MAG: nucleotide-binding protein [Thermoprotei archaeon]|nr:nucleotide-binding protein [Thermoprotei archaeon]